jgi:pimeloyl-ACP methyl ester carboxylesterase
MRQIDATDMEFAPPPHCVAWHREPGEKFYALLDETLAEIDRRDPSYLSRFQPSAPSISLMAAGYARHPLCAGYDATVVERALAEGLRYFAGAGALRGPATDRADPVAGFLCDSIIDAFCADRGALALEPAPRRERPIAQILVENYSQQRTPAGQRYFLRRAGNRPLLLINALGVPVNIWWRLLGDADHDFKVIVAESPCGDMLAGGMVRSLDISDEAEGLAAVVRAASVGPATVLGWCSGAKIAIDLAGRHPDCVSSLVLLAPSLTGIPGIAPDLCAFEKDFRWLGAAVHKQPSLAPSLAKTFTEPRPVIWDADAEQRAATLFGLPARERDSALTVPLSKAQSLITLMRRFAADDAYPADQILSRLDIPILAIMGRQDRIIQPRFASLVLKTYARSASQVILNGSGHYIHDLQYHYFRFLLTEFIGNGRAAAPSARISAG